MVAGDVPLRGVARGRDVARDADQVEAVEDLVHGRPRVLGRARDGGEHGGAHEPRRRGDVTGQAEQTGAVAGRLHLQAHQVDRLRLRVPQVHVVAQVGLVPVERRRVGQHADRVVVEHRPAVQELHHEVAAVRVVHGEVHGEGEVEQRLDHVRHLLVRRPEAAHLGVPDLHAGERVAHVLHGGARAEDPRAEVDEIDGRLASGGRRLRRQVRLRQPQRADREAGVVEPVARRPVEPERVHGDVAVRVRPRERRDRRAGGRGRPRVARRHDLHARAQLLGEVHGAAGDVQVLQADEAEVGTHAGLLGWGEGARGLPDAAPGESRWGTRLVRAGARLDGVPSAG